MPSPFNCRTHVSYMHVGSVHIASVSGVHMCIYHSDLQGLIFLVFSCPLDLSWFSSPLLQASWRSEERDLLCAYCLGLRVPRSLHSDNNVCLWLSVFIPICCSRNSFGDSWVMHWSMSIAECCVKSCSCYVLLEEYYLILSSVSWLSNLRFFITKQFQVCFVCQEMAWPLSQISYWLVALRSFVPPLN